MLAGLVGHASWRPLANPSGLWQSLPGEQGAHKPEPGIFRGGCALVAVVRGGGRAVVVAGGAAVFGGAAVVTGGVVLIGSTDAVAAGALSSGALDAVATATGSGAEGSAVTIAGVFGVAETEAEGVSLG